ncbi:MAG: dimethylarginine dimethylaminohydrolase family protein [Candidatus Hodarchaeota archaeon]
MQFGANSEVGKLHTVLMHKPGLEILTVTPSTLTYYGFRAIPDLKNLQTEFNLFVNILRNEGVEVVLLNDLLNKNSEIKLLPNLYFTRDILSISDIGLIVMNMGIPGRKDEPQIARKALEQKLPLAAKISSPGQLEGGDFVYLDESTLAVGYGPRTNQEGITQLIQGLKKSRIKEIISVPLPPHLIHLDQVFSVIAPKLCIAHEPSLKFDLALINRRGEVRKKSFLSYLRRKRFEMIKVNTEEVMQFGANVCAIEPRKILLYEWNERIIAELEHKGIDVIPIQGTELVKGGGGPHCMTCPILRKTSFN